MPYASPEEILSGLNSGKLHPLILYHVSEYDAYIHDLPRVLRGEFKVSKYHLEDSKYRFIKTGHELTLASRIARPLELRIIQSLQEATSKVPELRDVSVSDWYFEEKRKYTK